MTYRLRVLFVCEHDAGASRMCAAYLQQAAGDRYESLAAALEPAAGLRPEAAVSLSEDGLPVVDGPGLRMSGDLAGIVDRIVTLGFTLNPDVAREVPRPIQDVRVIRDTIRRLVERLAARLDTEAAVR